MYFALIIAAFAKVVVRLDHLLLHYEIAYGTLDFNLLCFGVLWIMSKSVVGYIRMEELVW